MKQKNTPEATPESVAAHNHVIEKYGRYYDQDEGKSVPPTLYESATQDFIAGAKWAVKRDEGLPWIKADNEPDKNGYYICWCTNPEEQGLIHFHKDTGWQNGFYNDRVTHYIKVTPPSATPAIDDWYKNSKQWFINNTLCLVGGERFLAEKEKRSADYSFLKDWMDKNYPSPTPASDKSNEADELMKGLINDNLKLVAQVSYYEMEIRKLSATKSNEAIEGCNVCGGKMAIIRGRYPKDADRIVCPTCNTEKLEAIESNNWRLTKLTDE